MKTFTKCALALAVLLAGIGTRGLQAGEGRTPISGQTTITVPGSYIVTRDFSFASGNGVEIQANNVTLDLNGHTITGPAGAGIVIHIDTASATQGILIRNGRLIAGFSGIYPEPTNRMSVRIERLEVAGFSVTGINIQAAEFAEVVHCHVHDDTGAATGVFIGGSSGAFRGNVSDNRVAHVGGNGIILLGLLAGDIRGNVVADYGLQAGLKEGIQVTSIAGWGAGGNLVEGNTVSAKVGDTEDDGIIARTFSDNNLIRNNVVTGAGRYGIVSFADGTRIERNVVSHGFNHGIKVGLGATGSFNHLEENQAQANTSAGRCGISFDNGNGHVFRNNNLRGNGAAGACGGALGTNTDGGGNIL